MTQVDLGLTRVGRFDSADPVVSTNDVNWKPGVSQLLAKIKALREAGLRAEHVALSFMKRRVQPLMARDTLGYQYTGNDDTLRMPGDEVDNDDIVDRLGRIFKDMPMYTPCPVPEYSAARPPNEVSSRTHCRVLVTQE
jgi:hypothetical protein